jgi:hypothetical protein
VSAALAGVDIIADQDGRAWLIENNCPPCVETATGLPHAEAFHDSVALDMLSGFVLPAIHRRRQQDGESEEGSVPASGGGGGGEADLGHWEQVTTPDPEFRPCGGGGVSGLGRNRLRWAAYLRSAASGRRRTVSTAPCPAAAAAAVAAAATTTTTTKPAS